MSNSTLLLLGLVPAGHAVYSPQRQPGAGGGGVLDQYLGIGEPLRVWNPDPV